MLKKRDDDLFQDTTMTFGEHLEELRGSLVKALVSLVIGTGLGLMVGGSVVDMITAPLKAALATYYKSESVEDYEQWAAKRAKDRLAVPYTVDEIKHLVDDQGQVFEIRYMHPKQVSHGLGTEAEAAPSSKRQRPAAGSGTGDSDEEQAEAKRLDAAELVPIFLWQPVENDARINPTTLSAQEAFAIWFKASLVVGVIISSPLVFYFIWSFVAAGLYPHEKKHVYTFLPFSLGLFLAGAALSYLFVFQPVLDFLLRFNQQLDLDPDPRISEWLSFVLFLPLGFGISFQLPLVMLFLERLGIFNVRSYMEKWRIAVLVIFVLS
ncbi:MAG: twin-arginine translocase subunit TatC, partial [Pirellulales bacterium]